MIGFITEKDLADAERCFPGITRFWESASPRPRTFLELVGRYQGYGRSSQREGCTWYTRTYR